MNFLNLTSQDLLPPWLLAVCVLALGCRSSAGDEADDDNTSGSDTDEDPSDTTETGATDSGSTGTTGTGTDDTVTGTDDTGTTETGTDDTGTTGTGTDDTGTTGTGSTDAVCPTFEFDDYNSFHCSVPVDCNGERCSASPTEALFDEQGCMRRRCEVSSHCEKDEVCFIAAACYPATCFPWGITCSDEAGPGGSTQCYCTDFGCAEEYIGWCIPQSAEPTDCGNTDTDSDTDSDSDSDSDTDTDTNTYSTGT